MKTRSSLLIVASLASAALVVAAPASRANAPAGRYVVSGGTVHDTKTTLTWEQVASTSTFTWGPGGGTAQSHCASLGGSWRVPAEGELLTLVDYTGTVPPLADGGKAPLIDSAAFPGTPADLPYWSSTPLGSTGQSWCVAFATGYSTYAATTALNYVRCVH